MAARRLRSLRAGREVVVHLEELDRGLHGHADGRRAGSDLLGRDGGLERYRHERQTYGVELFETTQTIASFDSGW